MKSKFTFASKAIAAFIFTSLLHIAGNAQTTQQSVMSIASTNNRLEAIVINGAVTINWPATPALIKNDIVIERSFDQSSFKTICYIFAPGNTEFAETLTHYRDRSPELTGKSTAYYRLRQTDKNDVVTYSDIITVSLK